MSFPVFIPSSTPPTPSTTLAAFGKPRGFILLIASESEDTTAAVVEEIVQPVIYSTTLLKILETVTTVAVLAVTLFLLIVLITGTRRFTVPFFKILTVLVVVVVIRSIDSIVLKLPTLWFGVMIAHQNIITLMLDMLSKRLLILLMFLMALNRFLIIFFPKLDSLLFTKYRCVVLCLICIAISTAESYVVMEASKMRRKFVPEVGFMDFIDIARPYEIGCLVFLAIALLSVLLHLTIIVYLRCFNRSSSTKTAKMQQRMFREVGVMTVVNTRLVFLLAVDVSVHCYLENQLNVSIAISFIDGGEESGGNDVRGRPITRADENDTSKLDKNCTKVYMEVVESFARSQSYTSLQKSSTTICESRVRLNVN